ncbi:hypothetical protein ACQP1G_20695 [Nocardia sp. CA-107356]|uniref:hypothetical protein n=1 Tax=Nocardia sp. CA-107356 TaxID=3239972 RepID=UPI003D8D947A
MEHIEICHRCEFAFKPIQESGVAMLREFEGYTVDLRLQQFRRAVPGEWLTFIDFDEPKGQELLKKMHAYVTGADTDNATTAGPN